MVNNSEEALSIIRNSVFNLFPDSRLLLFGSRARIENTTDSDYDFLIITKKAVDIRKKRFYKSILRKELAKYKIPADILIQSEEEVLQKKEITGHILKEVLKEGIVL